jgi:Fe2+ or Zn2+ uptake regulation protein
MDSHIARLKEYRLKITPKRKAILRLFLSKGRHMEPYEVYKALRRKLPTIGLPTVYRILSEFKEFQRLSRRSLIPEWKNTSCR